MEKRPRVRVAVVVVHEGKILLVEHTKEDRNYWLLPGGGLEWGEGLKEALSREVAEETGLEVTNIRYQASQHWPFPHQLMVGFLADYKSGELKLQEDELAEAGWFTPEEHPPIPPETTIAGRLISAMKKEIAGGSGN